LFCWARLQHLKCLPEGVPAITSANNATFVVGSAGSFTVTDTDPVVRHFNAVNPAYLVTQKINHDAVVSSQGHLSSYGPREKATGAIHHGREPGSG